MVTLITDETGVRQLKDSIYSRARVKPICVVSLPFDGADSRFDSAEIYQDTSGLADVYELPTGELTRLFAELMPANAHVFGGAARNYPQGFWQGEASVVGKLHYPTPPNALAKNTSKLISELWGFANAAGLVSKPKPNAVLENATVMSLFGSEVAILKRANGDMVSLRSELAFPGVPIDKVLKQGQVVRGYYDEASKTFTLESQQLSIKDVVGHFGLGAITLGLVKEVTRKTILVALHPSVEIEVVKDEVTGNPNDVMSDFYRVGEVYPFRLYRDAQGHDRLKSNDIDDWEEILPALALIEGGDPWLEEGRGVLGADEVEEIELLPEPGEVDFSWMEEVVEPQPVVVVTGPIPMPGPAAIVREAKKPVVAGAAGDTTNAFMVNHYKGEIAKLKKNLADERADYQRAVTDYNGLVSEIKKVKEDNSALRRENGELKKAKRAQSDNPNLAHKPWDSYDHFGDYAEWLKHEIYNYWIKNYTVQERKTFSIDDAKWSFGARFFEGWDDNPLTDTQLRKLIREVTELISGRLAETRGTETHPLTEGGKQIVRGRDKAMRMYIEEETAGARRLHYWVLADGGVELSQVEIHDNYEIR